MDVMITFNAGLDQAFSQVSEFLSQHVSDPPSTQEPLTFTLSLKQFLDLISFDGSQSETMDTTASKRKPEAALKAPSPKRPRRDLAPVPLLLNERAVMNITGTDIPYEVLLTASLGQKFVPPILLDKTRAILDIHKIQRETSEQYDSLFTEASRIINYFNPQKPTTVQKQIADIFSTAEAFLKEHPNICIKNCDKGNVSVIFDKQFYNQKMEAHLNNPVVYQKINTSSHLGLIRKNYNLLKEVSESGHVNAQQLTNIVSRETQSPRIYGLIKIHKDFKLRPIMSCVNTPGSRLFEVIMKPINRLDSDNPFTIKNTSQLITELKQVRLEENDILVSFDVVSMFTSIPPDVALDILIGNGITRHTTMKLELFVQAFRFCTQHATEFIFDDEYYKQISGLPMGAKGSPCIASIVLTYILKKALAKHPPVTFLKKYVDDIICITSRENAEAILRSLNDVIPAVQFTLEWEADRKINFLDVTLTRKSDLTIGTKWFCKPYASNRLVNYYSEHEGHTVRNTAVQYVRNILKYSDEEHHPELIIAAQKILFLNSIPDDIIQEYITEAISTLNVTTEDTVEDEYDACDMNYISTLVPNKLLKNMNRCARKHQTNVKFVNSFMNANANASIFSHLKRPLGIEYQNNVVVQLFCRKCRFTCISAVIHPVILFKAIGLSDMLHPYSPLNKHQQSSKHEGYRVVILQRCKTIPDTLRNTELLCRKNKLPIPFVARGTIDEDSLLDLSQN